MGVELGSGEVSRAAEGFRVGRMSDGGGGG